MGEDKKADKKRKRIVPKAPVQMIISREYVGTQTVTEAFIPIISEDIRKKIAEGDTFDNEGCPLRMYAMEHEKQIGQIWRFYSMAGIRMENKIYEVGMYCRLSKDDGTDNESASIATQKSILTDYVKRQGWHFSKNVC